MKTVLLLLLCFMSIHLFAQQNTIIGIVKEAGKKQPLAYCSVIILNTSVGTNTDEKGQFTIVVPKHLTSPKLVFFFTGYKPDTLSLDKYKSNFTIYLNATTSTLNEVTVTGLSQNMILKEDPTSIRIVSTRAIEQTTESNIIDLLVKNVPGLNAVKTGPNVSKPFIRGLGYSRVETLYDGVPQEGQQFEDEEVLAVDMYSIDKAEVVLGPTTLQYGPDALAGLVNLIPSMPKNTNNELHGRLFSEYQSNNGLIGNGLRLSYGGNKWAFIGRGSFRVARNYTNKVDGRVYNTGFREINASGTLQHTSTNGYTNFSASVYDNHQGIPDGSRDSASRKFTKAVYEDPDDDINNRPIVSDKELNSYKLSPIHQNITHYRFYSKSQYDLKNNSTIYAMLAFQQNLRREYDFPIHTDIKGVSLRLNSLNYDFRYHLPSLLNTQYTVGANGIYQTNTNYGATDIPIPDYHLFDFGAFIFGKWSHSNWTLSGGIRYDVRHVTGSNFYTRENPLTDLTEHVALPDTAGAELLFPAFSRNFKGWSADLGITYQINDHISIKANVARGSGAPHVSEFASNGLDGSAHAYFMGKPDAVPENNLQEDLGFSLVYKDINAVISVFNNFLNDYIYLEQLADSAGNPIEIVPGNKTFQYQQGAADLYGIEGTIDLHPSAIKGFSIINNFALTYGLNKEPEFMHEGNKGEYLPNIPPFKLLTSAVEDIKTKSHTFPLISLRAEADINGPQNRYLATNSTETATPGYTLFNTSVNVTFDYAKKSALQVQLVANNMLNTAYQSNLSRLKYFEYYSYSPNGRYGIYSMGRNFCAKLIMPF